MWETLLFSGTAALLLTWTVLTVWHLRWARRLPPLEKSAGVEPAMEMPHGNRIKCSVVIAARNEEERVEETIRHLFAQGGVEAEFIVVDDRSTDRTSEILQRLVREDARLRVKRVEVLPEGWLGKCHACHVGASAAQGDWILFTDADCWLKPDVLARALQAAERTGAEHITLTSGLATASYALRASHLLFLISLSNWFSGVNRDRPNAYLGIGAFNLMSAAAYGECGGYQALRLTVLDDMRLGLLLRRAGKRTRGFIGGDDAECHWGTTLGRVIRLMEKNYFAAVDFRLGLVIAGSVLGLLVLSILIAGIVAGTAAGLVAALSPLLAMVPAAILAHRLGWSWFSAVLVPFMFPVFLYTLLNSTIVTLRQDGVVWRDTFYSLETLRAGTVR